MSYIFKDLLRNWLPDWFNQPANPMIPGGDNIYFPRDPHDVYHMAFVLSQVIVPDLVPHILDLAEYWIKASHDRREPQIYVEHNSGRPYLAAAVSNATGPRMVRKVEISITSHDQGWSDYRPFHGTYEGSWTWFEAEILSTDSARRPREARELCRNVHAERRDKTHLITWRWDAEDENERNLVRSLGPDSVILVVPWARFQGWKNHVSYASVDIYAAAVRRL